MSRPEVRDEEAGLTVGRLIFWMVALVVVGMPMVYVLWEALNHLLSGHPERVRAALVLPVLAVFAVFVFFLGRLVRRWDAGDGS